MRGGTTAAAAPRKVSAVIIWGIGLWTTQAFIAQIGVGGYTWFWAVVIQLGLTGMQSAFWSARASGPAIIAVMVDTLINFGGLYPYLFNIPSTDAWQQMMRAFPAFVPASPSSWMVGAIALLICAAIAGAPELIWKER
jgi:hypothetical protein